MKSKVILICVAALCFEFVASIPYSIDFQKYSGYKTRPALDSSLQQSAPRPYQYYNQWRNTGAHINPSTQLQEQQLPKVNRDNYFSRNQQRYLPKSPPQQAEITNEKYVGQQITPFEPVPNSQLYENRPIEVQQNNRESFAQLPPQIVVPEPAFIPAIPAVPSRPSYTSANEALRRVEYHNHRVETPQVQEIEIPVIKPPPTWVPETVPVPDNFDRLFAQARNPVEQISEPKKPQRPSIDLYLSHPKIREVLSTTKHKKRYLVIHPDGTVEHVDKLESVAERHPNYFLVKAGDVVANLNNQKAVIPTPPSNLPLPKLQPYHENSAVLHTSTPDNVVEAPIEKPVTVATGLLNNPIPINVHNVEPSKAPEKPIVQDPSTLPPVVTPTEDISSTTEAVLTTTNQSIQPSEIEIKKEVLPPHVDTDVNSVPNSEPNTKVAEKTEEVLPHNEVPTIVPLQEPITTEGVLVSSTTEVPLESPAAEVTAKEAATTLAALETTTINPVDPHLIDLTANEVEVNESPLPTEAPKDPTLVQLPAKTEEKPNLPETPVEIKITPVEKNNDPNTLTPVEQDLPKNNTVKDLTPTDPLEDVLAKIDEFLQEDVIKNAPVAELVLRDFGDSDVTNPPQNPIVWFKSTDPDFMDKLIDKDRDLDVVYFFQIHNQPKIEKDVKTTIHPNGTIVEDVIESIWAFEGDEPTITKTTRIIHPDDL